MVLIHNLLIVDDIFELIDLFIYLDYLLQNNYM